MDIKIANAYAEHGVRAERQESGAYKIVVGEVVLARTNSQALADDVAFAYVMGRIDGHRAAREDL